MLNPLSCGISEVFINEQFLNSFLAMPLTFTKRVSPTPFMVKRVSPTPFMRA